MTHGGAPQVARAAHDALNRGDREAFVRCWTADCEYRPALEATLEGGGAYRGHDGIRDWWRRMFEEWTDVRSDLHEIREIGDSLVVLGTLRGRGPTSGVATETPFGQLATVRGGKITTSRDFLSHAEALEAAGARP